jgi:WD40 repeat protein
MATNNPYVGPRSFSSSETLYGRDRELRVLTDRLISERIVLLHAPSGAGKTSLVQAGLIPQLASEGFFIHPPVRINAEYPTDLMSASETAIDLRRYNRYVFSTLLSLEERYASGLRTKFNRLARLSLSNYLTLRSIEDQREGPEFLIFDQFEEILSLDYNDRPAKMDFFTQLRAVLKNRNRWALFVMRTDYVGALEPYARTIPTYFSNTFHLELLGVKAALDAIQQPAKKAGVDFSDSAAQKLVDDLRRVQVQTLDGSVQSQLGLYIEPVQLQVVCYRIWENKSARKTTITEKDLDNVGDVNQSLAEYYAISIQKSAQETETSERDIRQWFNNKLITPEGTRSLVRIGAGKSEGLPKEVIANLENSHLIRPEKRAGQTWYELAHDRLIEPIRADNKKWFDTHLSLFQRQAHLWDEQGRGEGLLLRGQELAVAEQEATEIELTPDEVDFLEACRLLRHRERRDKMQRRLIFAGLVMSLILFFAAVFFSLSAVSANQNFENQVVTAQAASTQAIAQQSTAQAASTQAIAQQSAAQAASTQAIANAHAAATAQANAEIEKVNASEQERLAQEQRVLAQSNELAVQSILAQNRGQLSLANLLAIEAFQMIDHSRTRIQLLSALNAASRLFAGISSKAGIIPYVKFDASNQGLIAPSYFSCDADTRHYVCRQDFFRQWQMQIAQTRVGLETYNIVAGPTISDKDAMLDAIALSPGKDQIASVYCEYLYNNLIRCQRQKLVFWNAETYTPIGNEILIAENSYNNRAVLMSYSPDGDTLALSINDETLLFVDAQTYTEKSRIEVFNGISQMAFSPDGKVLAFTNSRDNTLTFITMDNLERQELEIPSNTRALSSLAYNLDGGLLALGSREGLILLWDVQKGAIVNQFYDREGRIFSLAFSPDGKTLAAGHNNYYVTLWDIPGRQLLLRPFLRHTLGVQSLAFNEDGSLLASSAGEIVLWDMSPESWLKKSCEMAGRNFTQLEWQQFFPNEEYRITCPAWPAGQ